MQMRVGDQWYHIESKDYGDKTTSNLKAVITQFAKAFDPTRDKRAYDRAKKAHGRVKETFRKDAQKELEKFLAGRINGATLERRLKAGLKDAYAKAFRNGHAASGMDYLDLDTDDKTFLRKFQQTENKYLTNFIADMQASRGSMKYTDRLDMYADTVDSVFEAGRVDAYPEDGTLIYWVMGIAEHCPDCSDMAGRSPYTPATLPTTPKSGYTKCKSRCNCSLRIRYVPPQAPVDLKVTPVSKERAAELMGESVDWNTLDKFITHDFSASRPTLRRLHNAHWEHHVDTAVGLLEQLATPVAEDDLHILHALGSWILMHRDHVGK